MYTIKGNEIFRKDEAIASVKDGELDFYEGMARFRAPAVRFFNTIKDELNEAIDDLDVDAPDDGGTPDTETEAPVVATVKLPKESKKEAKANEDQEARLIAKLSKVIGMSVSKPHPKFGWRGTMMRDELMLKRKRIMATDILSDYEKKQILNKFI